MGQNRARPIIVHRCIFADVYRVQRSCSHGSGCCVVVSVGVLVGGAMGRKSRYMWIIFCASVGLYGYGIVRCDWYVVRRSFPGREWLYTRTSIMVWIFLDRCKRAMVTLCHVFL